MPTWQDYLNLSFDEIRVFGADSIQVLRRLRAALTGLAEFVTIPDRRDAVLPIAIIWIRACAGRTWTTTTRQQP